MVGNIGNIALVYKFIHQMDCLLYLLPLLLCFHKSKNHSNRSKCSPTFLLDHWNIIHNYHLTKFTLLSVSDKRGISKACSIKSFDRNILLFKVRFQLKHSSDIIYFLMKNIFDAMVLILLVNLLLIISVWIKQMIQITRNKRDLRATCLHPVSPHNIHSIQWR